MCWSEPITRGELPDETEVKHVSGGKVEARPVVISETKAKHVGESKLEAPQFGATALIAIIFLFQAAIPFPQMYKVWIHYYIS